MSSVPHSTKYDKTVVQSSHTSVERSPHTVIRVSLVDYSTYFSICHPICGKETRGKSYLNDAPCDYIFWMEKYQVPSRAITESSALE